MYTRHGVIWCKNGRRQSITLNIMLNYIFEEEVQWQEKEKKRTLVRRARMSDDRLTEINNWIEWCKPCTIIYSSLVLINRSYQRTMNFYLLQLTIHSISNDQLIIQRLNRSKSLFVFDQCTFLSSRRLFSFCRSWSFLRWMINERRRTFWWMSVVELMSMRNASQFSSFHSLMEVNR